MKAKGIEEKLRQRLIRPMPEAGRLKRIGLLIRKRNSGKRLSRSEFKELEEFAGTARGDARLTGGAEWVGSREKLGNILGVHPNTFPQWMKAFPEDPRIQYLKRANGDWNVAEWRGFMERNGLIGESARGGAQATSAAISRKLDLELQRLEEQVRELRRVNDAEERKFLVRAEVEEWIAKRAAWIRGRLLKLKREMPPRFAGLDQTEFAVRLGPLVDGLIEDFTEARTDLTAKNAESAEN